MEQIINFVQKNKFIIIIFISLIIIFIIFCKCFLKTNFVENLDNVSNDSNNTNNTNNLESLTRTNVYLKHAKSSTADIQDEITTEANKPFYLAVAPIDQCGNIIRGPNECFYNVAILQNVKNVYSRFQIIPKFGASPPKYRLMSMANHITPTNPHLSQNLNYADKSSKLCFDDGDIDDVIYFDIEEIDGKYRLKFGKKIGNTDNYQHFYLGECSNIDSICNKSNVKHKRLCLFREPERAILFEIELDHPDYQEDYPEGEYYEEEHFTEDNDQGDLTQNLPVNTDDSIYSLQDAPEKESFEIVGITETLLGGIEDNYKWN